MSRIRLQLEKGIKSKIVIRSNDYLRLRFYWLHELRQLRAKRKISGINTKQAIKIAQRELARIRKTH